MFKAKNTKIEPEAWKQVMARGEGAGDNDGKKGKGLDKEHV